MQLRRTISTELADLLRGGGMLQVADLYTIELSGGSVIRWTNHDVPVSISGQTWSAGPGLLRDRMVFAVGVEAQNMDLVITADASQQINSVPLVPFILNGGFDGAWLTLEKAFRADLGDAAWVGKLQQFDGRISDVESAGSLRVRVTVRSMLEVFNLPLPPNVYQPQCLNTLYDSNCGIFQDGYDYDATVETGSGALRLTFGHTLPQAAGYFDLGGIVFLTGANAGIRRTVRSMTSTQITVMQPWPAVVAAGDVFKIYQGCDLTQATCQSRFGNLARFRGQPYIPPPETIT